MVVRFCRCEKEDRKRCARADFGPDLQASTMSLDGAVLRCGCGPGPRGHRRLSGAVGCRSSGARSRVAGGRSCRRSRWFVVRRPRYAAAAPQPQPDKPVPSMSFFGSEIRDHHFRPRRQVVDQSGQFRLSFFKGYS